MGPSTGAPGPAIGSCAKIEHAIAAGRRIVPVRTPEFDFEDMQRYLPAATAVELSRFQSAEVPLQFFKYAAQQLVEEYLLPIDDVALVETPKSAQPVVERAERAAAAAPVVTDVQLSAEEHFERGLKLQDGREIEAALVEYDRALELDPDHVVALLSRAVIHAQLGNNELAKRDHDHAFRLDPLAVRTRSFFDRAVEMDPTNGAALVSRGLALSEAGEDERAIADFDQAIALDPSDQLAIFNRGAVYEQMGDLDAALRDFDRAVELRPDSSYDRAVRGSLLATLGNLDGARADWHRALELDPDSVWTFVFRGETLLRLGDVDAALTDLDTAVRLDPRNPTCRLVRAHARYEIDDLEGAFEDIDLTLELDPSDAESLILRGELSAELGDLDAALRDLDRALNLAAGPLRASVHATRAYVREQLEDRDGAIDDLRIGRALAGDDRELQTWFDQEVRRLDGRFAGIVRRWRRTT